MPRTAAALRAPGQVDVWRKIIGFRNIVVHRYLDVDPAIVRAVFESNLQDLSAFVRSIRDRLVAG